MKKRILGLFLISVVCLSVLTGCGKQKCSICGETKSGKTKTVMGEKVFICNDCIDDLNSLFK